MLQSLAENLLYTRGSLESKTSTSFSNFNKLISIDQFLCFDALSLCIFELISGAVHIVEKIISAGLVGTLPELVLKLCFLLYRNHQVTQTRDEFSFAGIIGTIFWSTGVGKGVLESILT